MKKSLLTALLLLAPFTAFAETCKTTKPINTDAYTKEFGTRNIAFIAVDFNSRDCWVINEKEVDERHGPYSTFKIPHTLIALETGTVKSADELIEWDQAKYPAQSFWPDTWKQSQTMATAFKHSAFWYYQALVPRMTPDDYRKWLAKFSYGNQTFTPGSNRFWLNSELQISPAEQVNFMLCLLQNRCNIKPANLSVYERIALQESKDNLSLYAKTGAGPLDPNNFDGAFEGWFVGYIKEKNGTPVTAFAIYMRADSFSEIKNYRKDLSLRLLVDLGFWAK